MLKIVGIVVAVLIIAFIGYVLTRSPHFRYERSTVFKAPPEKIFPYLSQFKLGSEWSPFEKVDPNMKKEIIGTDGTVGAKMNWEGNKDAGSGQLEFLKIQPNEFVEMRLQMIKPFPAENLVRYELKKEGDGTKFTWIMSGENGFFGKLMTVMIDCEAMIGGQFEKGFENLKPIVDGPQAVAGTGLNENPEVRTFPAMHYVYVEKIGPFMETAKGTWGEFQKSAKEIASKNKMTGAMALYKMQPQMLYRAGASLEAKPASLPAGFQYTHFEGGKYTVFTLKGSYAQLPVVMGRVMELVKEKNIQVSDNFFIENYANDPATTPEDQLITEIMIPTK
jgi:DNA gyrase inhibitor